MRNCTYKLASALILCTAHAMLFAQSSEKQTSDLLPVSGAEVSRVELQQKLGKLSSALMETREQLEKSQRQVELLQEELKEVQKQLNLDTGGGSSSNPAAAPGAMEAKNNDLAEQQEVLKSQVKLLDQTKVESGSKYPVRLTGLILFNAFANDGVVDNLDLPEVALRPAAGVSHGSVGAGMRQTIIGIQGIGPKVAGARTFADVRPRFLRWSFLWKLRHLLRYSTNANGKR